MHIFICSTLPPALDCCKWMCPSKFDGHTVTGAPLQLCKKREIGSAKPALQPADIEKRMLKS